MRVNMTQADIKDYFPDVIDCLGSVIPAFVTERDCREFSSKIGWGACDIIRIDKRFERVYVAGKKYIHQKPDACGHIIEQIDFPLGEFDDENRKVVSIKKVIQKQKTGEK